MQCPKCGHQQLNTEECESCGIFFAKYQKLQQQTVQQPLIIERKRNYMLPIALAVIAGISIGAYLFSGSSTSTPSVAGTQSAKVVRNTPAPSTKPATSGHDFAGQLNATTPRNEIERARNATVFIKTKWGLGSGFFFTKDCQILTNRHVIEISQEDVAKIQAEFDKRAKYLDTVKTEIDRRKREFNLHCRKCDGEEYRRNIGNLEEKYNDAKKELSDMDERLFALRHIEDIQVILADGTNLPASIASISEKYDLAVLKLQEESSCANLSPGHSKDLNYGDPLYTIGNPLGIKLVVTSGIFSGYTQVQGVKMLQTDAPINPGNSGGPLIDSNGKVYGINTAILTNAEGIGFALPIELAESEFGL